MSRHVLIVVLVSSSLMGCIIPKLPDDYEIPPNTPARVLGTEETPQDEILRIDLDDYEGRQEFQIVAQIEDPDVDQDLTGLAFVDPPPDLRDTTDMRRATPVAPDVTIAAVSRAEEDREIRRESFDIPLNRVQAGECHAIVIAVNAEYTGFPPVPATVNGDADEGTGTWIVAVTQPSEGVDFVDLERCPEQQLMPGMQ